MATIIFLAPTQPEWRRDQLISALKRQPCSYLTEPTLGERLRGISGCFWQIAIYTIYFDARLPMHSYGGTMQLDEKSHPRYYLLSSHGNRHLLSTISLISSGRQDIPGDDIQRQNNVFALALFMHLCTLFPSHLRSPHPGRGRYSRDAEILR